MSSGYWPLLAVFVTAQGLGWYLTLALTKHVWQVVPLSQLGLSSENMMSVQKWITVAAAWAALCYQSLFWYCFLGRAEDQRFIWWHNFPDFYTSLIIFLIMLEFSLLLFATLLRVYAVFEGSVYQMPLWRVRIYIMSIAVHSLIELAAVIVQINRLRWILFAVFDLILCVLCCSLCYEISSRLLRVVQRNIRAGAESEDDFGDVKNQRRKSVDPRHHSTKQDLQMIKVAAKMTVLSGFLSLSVICWSLSPIFQLFRADLRHRNFYRVFFVSEITIALLCYLYLSLSVGDPLYDAMFSRWIHPCVLSALLGRATQQSVHRHLSSLDELPDDPQLGSESETSPRYSRRSTVYMKRTLQAISPKQVRLSMVPSSSDRGKPSSSSRKKKG